MNRHRQLFPTLLFLALTALAVGWGGEQTNRATSQVDPRDGAVAVATARPLRDTYLTLGDSVAAGMGASRRSAAYGEVLFRALVEVEPALTRHVNLAIPGETSESLLRRQIERARRELESGRVRLVTLAIGANDLLGQLAECWYRLASEACRQAGEREVRSVSRNLDEAIRELLSADPGVQIVLVDYYDPVGQILPRSRVYVAELNEAIVSLASSLGLPVVRISALFNGREGELTRIFAFDVHPNDEGHRLIAEMLAGVIVGRQLLATN